MRLTFTLFLTILFSSFLYSQCPDCTPDESCTNDNNFPQMCPEIIPPQVAGVYFEQNITVWLPSQVTDPETEVTVDLIEVVITSITGVPFGVDFVLNSEDNTYYPSDGDEFACATACGTPLVPGEYEITIIAHVVTEAFGFEVEVDQPFSLYVTVLPGDGSNGTFSYDYNAGCSPLEATFEALLNEDPQPTTWNWDFGNGNTSQSQFPPTQVYTEPGEYQVTLETNIYDFVLTDVLVSGLAGGWWGDVEELTSLSNPDPYFVITNGSGVAEYTSPSLTDVQSGEWLGINLPLTNPPYTISFYDEDVFSNDDYLGDWDIPFTDGTFIFDADGTTGSLNINLQLGEQFNNEEIINVFPLPNTDFTVDEEINTIYFSNTNMDSFLWYLNGDTLQGAMDSSLTMYAAGIYTCLLTNIYGCSAMSEPYTQCPEFTPSYDSETGILSAPETMLTYQWFYNGLEIDGATSYFIVVDEPGNYSVLVTTDYGCESMSDMFILTGLEELGWISDLKVFPNPADNVLNISGSLASPGIVTLSIKDMTGRTVMSETMTGSHLIAETIDLSALASGSYLFMIQLGQNVKHLPLVVR